MHMHANIKTEFGVAFLFKSLLRDILAEVFFLVLSVVLYQYVAHAHSYVCSLCNYLCYSLKFV